MNFPRYALLSLSLSVSVPALATLSDEELLVDPLASEVPYVLSAVRLNQPAAEVPASVTVLDADFIAATGARTITELMRYVPGMIVGPEIYDNNDSVQYHGGPAHFPKGMQVLLDGHSIYGAAVNATSWYQAGIAVEDIQRIEVVRGPNAPSYGTNAYQAVINIITRHAADSQGAVVAGEAGNNKYRYAYARAAGGSPGQHWRLSFVHKQTGNLEDLYSTLPPCQPCTDNRRADALMFRSDHELDGNNLQTSLIITDTRRETPFFHPAVTDNTITERSYLAGLTLVNHTIRDHEVKFTSSLLWTDRLNDVEVSGIMAGHLDDDLRALFILNPEAAMQLGYGQAVTALDYSDPQQVALATALAMRYADPADFVIPVSGEVRGYASEYRYDIELQDTWAVSDTVTLLSGLGYRYELVDSEHFYGGEIDDRKYRVFANANWKPTTSWASHAGVMYEREGNHEESISYRLALNYLFSPLSSVRLVYNNSGRTPDFFEENADWSFRLSDIETTATLNGDTYFETYQGPGDLHQQRIEAIELGYHGRGYHGHIEGDIKVFREYMYDVLYRWPSTRSPVTFTDNQIWFTGVEWQGSWTPFHGTTMRVTGALVDIDYDLEDGLTTEHIFALYAPRTFTTVWMQEWPWQLQSTLSLLQGFDYGNQKDGVTPTDMQRLDAHIYRPLTIAGLDGQWQLRAQRDFSGDPYLPESLGYNSVFRWQAGIRVDF